jgi:hypothetical protein
MKAYHISGYPKSRSKKLIGDTRYLSDGMLFSTQEKAETYGSKYMHTFSVRIIENCPESYEWYIDFWIDKNKRNAYYNKQ